MPSNKTRVVKRVAASEFRRPPHAEPVETQVADDVIGRPRLLSDRFRVQSRRRRIENDDVVVETFTLPLEAARRKVRDIISDVPLRGYRKIVERWRQLPDGQIEFSMRRLPVAD